MINAIINNNESIPSIMCEDIERTIFDARLATLPSIRMKGKDNVFCEIYHGRLFAKFNVHNIGSHRNREWRESLRNRANARERIGNRGDIIIIESTVIIAVTIR